MAFQTAVTFSSLIDDVTLALQGYSMNQDQETCLSSAIGAGDVTFMVDDPEIVSRGMCEIGDEIVRVATINGQTATVAPNGRGWRSSLAQTHPQGETVRFSPTWPRATVATSINDTINAVYPLLFGVDAFEITPDVKTMQYVLPSDTERILSVEQRAIGFKEWRKISEWTLTFKGNLTDFGTGVYATLPCISTLGVVRIWRAFRPVALTNATDAFSTTGLPASCKDVIVLGAAKNLIGWIDVGRLPVATVEANALAPNRPQGAAFTAAREITGKFQQRLLQEQSALEARFPPRIHRTR